MRKLSFVSRLLVTFQTVTLSLISGFADVRAYAVLAMVNITYVVTWTYTSNALLALLQFMIPSTTFFAPGRPEILGML